MAADRLQQLIESEPARNAPAVGGTVISWLFSMSTSDVASILSIFVATLTIVWISLQIYLAVKKDRRAEKAAALLEERAREHARRTRAELKELHDIVEGDEHGDGEGKNV